MRDNSQILYNELLQQIQDGVLTNGMAIPSENELCARYDISRPTVRRVLDRLCLMHLLEKRPGIGTFVTDPDREKNAFMYSDFTIGTAMLFDYSPHYSMHIIDGFNKSPYGRNVFLKALDAKRIDNGFVDADVDALIFKGYSPEICRKLMSYGKPALMFNYVPPFPGIGSLRVDHRLEAARGMDYLLRCGHREIAVIGGCHTEMRFATDLRARGCMDAFAAAGVPGNEELWLSDRLHCCLPDDELMNFVRTRRFTAAFFANASYFRNFAPYFNSLSGRRICDIQCVVFDDMEPFNEYGDMPLAYIKMPLEKFGVDALEYLRRKAHDPAYPVIDKKLPCSMVIRY